MEYKMIDCNSYKIHTIKTDKFKNCSIEIIYKNKLVKEEITANNMVVDMLMHTSKKYPTRREVAIALENLYSASLRGVSTKLGNSFFVSFVMDFLNPKYCEKGYLEDIIEFQFDMIQNPNITNGKFDSRSFNIIKNRLKADIESVTENSTRYALRTSLRHMDSKSPSSYSMLGTIEELDGITTTNLIDTYHNIINNYDCDIYVIGNLDMDYVVKLIKDNFNNRTIKNNDVNLYVDNKVKRKITDITENANYEQDTFVMIHNAKDFTKRERDYVIHLFNIIFGSGGLTSKLYQYVREENSLCYSINTVYQKYDQLLMIYSGLDGKNKELCMKLVDKALNEMINGDFSDEEIDNAKKTIISSIRMSEDTLGGIVNNYFFNNIDQVDLYDERVKQFNTVTREEIMDVAKKIKLNTVYLLTREEK